MYNIVDAYQYMQYISIIIISFHLETDGKTQVEHRLTYCNVLCLPWSRVFGTQAFIATQSDFTSRNAQAWLTVEDPFYLGMYRPLKTAIWQLHKIRVPVPAIGTQATQWHVTKVAIKAPSSWSNLVFVLHCYWANRNLEHSCRWLEVWWFHSLKISQKLIYFAQKKLIQLFQWTMTPSQFGLVHMTKNMYPITRVRKRHRVLHNYTPLNIYISIISAYQLPGNQ